MLLIPCPYCGEARNENEFTFAGEAHIVRPEQPGELSDAEWGDYLFCRRNIRGLQDELWHHVHGCRRHLIVRRHSESCVIVGSWRQDEQPPPLAGGGA